VDLRIGWTINICKQAHSRSPKEALTFVPLAICADLVAFKLQQTFDSLLVVRRPIGGGTSRHRGQEQIMPGNTSVDLFY
jgi:hypothetical protein